MKELLETLRAWQADGVQVGRAVVLRTYGSAPRPEGAVLLYASDGRIAGSVSGGCVEGAAAQEIDAARRSGLTRIVHFGVTDDQAWSVGLACGGTIDALIEPDVPREAIDAAGGDGASVVITVLPGEQGTDSPDRLVFKTDGGLRGSTGDPSTDGELVAAAVASLEMGRSRVFELGERQYFLETFPVPQRLIVFGAVENARPLVRLAHELGFETIVIDGRPAFATHERFPDADRLIVGWPDEVAGEIGLGLNDSVAVLTHDPKFDEPAIVQALRRGCRYVGAIGSRKTQADRRDRLRERGVSNEELARLHGPIGLDLGGRAPAEIALAIISEVVATRYGASGDPLRDRAAAGKAVEVLA